MPSIKNWKFEDLPYGEFNSQRIDFSIDDHNFFMVFTPVILTNSEYKYQRETLAGFSVPDKSYDIKFDREENFESGDFYMPPSSDFSQMTPGKMKRLGKGVCKLIEFHCSITGAEVYFASAENGGLKQFYDRLANKHSDELEYKVTTGLGEEGLDYAIKTSKFKY